MPGPRQEPHRAADVAKKLTSVNHMDLADRQSPTEASPYEPVSSPSRYGHIAISPTGPAKRCCSGHLNTGCDAANRRPTCKSRFGRCPMNANRSCRVVHSDRRGWLLYYCSAFASRASSARPRNTGLLGCAKLECMWLKLPDHSARTACRKNIRRDRLG